MTRRTDQDRRIEVLADPAYLGTNVNDILRLLKDFDRQYRAAWRASHEGGGSGRGGRNDAESLPWSDPTFNIVADERKAKARDAVKAAAVKVNFAAIEIRAAAKLLQLTAPPDPPSERRPNHVVSAYGAATRRRERGEE